MGNSQKVKGYAQVEVRAMPKMCERGYAQKQTRTKNITERTNSFLKGKQKNKRIKEGITLKPHPFSIQNKHEIHTWCNQIISEGRP